LRLFKPALYAQGLAPSAAVTSFIENKAAVNKGTAKVIQSYLRTFQQFVFEVYQTSVDDLLSGLLEDQRQNHISNKVYDVLSQFVKWQVANNTKTTKPVSARIIRYKTRCIKDFLEYNDVLIIPSKFRIKVSLPRGIERSKEALDKDFVRKILLAAEMIKHRAYLHFLAVTGCRAEEALSITIADLDLESDPPRIFINGEYTKTRRDRTVFITKELKDTLRLWLEYKYRPRQVRLVGKDGIPHWIENYKPPMKKTDRVFQVVHHDGTVPSLKHMYDDFRDYFGKLLDRIGFGDREAWDRRRKITLHSFRRFAKTTISDLGYADFSEYHIGHANSPYWTKSEKEKIKLFSRIEPYLTFLDYEQLEARGADMITKVEQGNEQMLIMQKQMRLLAEIAATDDPLVKKQKWAELAATGFFETTKVD
jgi:integrase